MEHNSASRRNAQGDVGGAGPWRAGDSTLLFHEADVEKGGYSRPPQGLGASGSGRLPETAARLSGRPHDHPWREARIGAWVG